VSFDFRVAPLMVSALHRSTDCAIVSSLHNTVRERVEADLHVFAVIQSDLL
jgi:hypothetical protein